MSVFEEWIPEKFLPKGGKQKPMDEIEKMLIQQLETAVKTAQKEECSPREVAELTVAVAKLMEVLEGYWRGGRPLRMPNPIPLRE